MTSPRGTDRRFDALFAQAREPIVLLGPNRRLIAANKAFEDLTGHPAESLVGLDCNPHGPTRPGELIGLGGSLSPPPEALAGRPTAVLTLILHPSGERLWRRIEFWPFHQADGTLSGLVGLLRPAESPPRAPDSEADRLRVELLEVRARLESRHGFDTLIGRGPAHRRLLDQVRAAAETSAPILVVGEVGTGRRTVARAVHALGPRRRSPLLLYDVATLPAEVLARELFRPADDSTSHLAAADGSTLILDDVLELARDLQARLVSAADGRVRLVGTTAGDPDLALRGERIRPDFYYLLTAMVVRTDALRDRRDEIPLLAQHFLERINSRGGPQRVGFTADAVEALGSYDWPGNLRELARVVEAGHASAPSDSIRADDLPAGIRGHLGSAYLPPPAPPSPPLDEVLIGVERRMIEGALARARRNKSRAAEILGISRPRLYRRIRELGLPDDPDEPDEPAAG